MERLKIVVQVYELCMENCFSIANVRKYNAHVKNVNRKYKFPFWYVLSPYEKPVKGIK